MPSHVLNETSKLIGALKDRLMLWRSVPTVLGPRPQLTIGRTAYRKVSDVDTVLLPDCVEHLLRVSNLTFAQMIRGLNSSAPFRCGTARPAEPCA